VITAGAAFTPAVAMDMVVGERIVVAQAVETTPTVADPASGHEHATTPALPDPNPKLNKKRAAFWGVSFMLATSLAFAIFGTWAIKKTPKPGQQRPE
jgi:hypothetical protein